MQILLLMSCSSNCESFLLPNMVVVPLCPTLREKMALGKLQLRTAHPVHLWPFIMLTFNMITVHHAIIWLVLEKRPLVSLFLWHKLSKPPLPIRDESPMPVYRSVTINAICRIYRPTGFQPFVCLFVSLSPSSKTWGSTRPTLASAP